jgi:hypothetical protein
VSRVTTTRIRGGGRWRWGYVQDRRLRSRPTPAIAPPRTARSARSTARKSIFAPSAASQAAPRAPPNKPTSTGSTWVSPPKSPSTSALHLRPRRRLHLRLGPVNIRGEGKRSNLKRSVRSGSASFGILLWITTTEAPLLEQFQIEYAAGTWPAHPGGIPDADAGANCAIILTNCDGPIVNEVHILGEWYVCFTFQDCDNIKSRPSLTMKRYINRGLYIGSGAKNCVNARVIQPVIDGTSNGGSLRAPTTASTSTATPAPPSLTATSFSLRSNGCANHAIGISAPPGSAASSAAPSTTACRRAH